jgi:7-carboxy-7-deazaguanine synthase
MSYAVKELFYTLQGEGANAGRPSVFCRFAGCNLWSGREQDRDKAVCWFCDTDFVGTDGTGGGKFATAEALADAVRRHWPDGVDGEPFVVCTGGEPLLQLDAPLTAALKARGFEIAVETNGTQPVPPGVDWVCVSPKAGAELVVDVCRVEFPLFPDPAHGRAGRRRQHAAGYRVLPCPPALAAEPSDPQDDRHPVG